MTITFFIQSKNNPAKIYVRLREGREIDAKAKTNLSVDPDNFKKGKIKLKKLPAGARIAVKKQVQSYNEAMNNLQEMLDVLRSKINVAVNNKKDYESLNSSWLKEIVEPKKTTQLPKDITSYFDYYLEAKRRQLSPNTLKKIGTFKSRMEAFQKDFGKLYIPEVNLLSGIAIQKWCDKKDYAHNTKIQTLKILKTVCNHAKENGIPTHPELEFICKGFKYQKTDHIHLTIDEINKIADTDLSNEANSEKLEVARDWLIISCYTAQRVSDFLKFTRKDIKHVKGLYFLQIIQEKTKKPVLIPLTDVTMKILSKRNGEFPPIFSTNSSSNSTLYNKFIKDVCRIAKIHEMVTVARKNPKTNRYEEMEIQKYKAVSTHIGRRSFATNFYSHIGTPLLIAATGHSSEAQFLRYVGGTGDHNAIALANAMESFLSSRNRKAEMRVIGKAANI